MIIIDDSDLTFPEGKYDAYYYVLYEDKDGKIVERMLGINYDPTDGCGMSSMKAVKILKEMGAKRIIDVD